MDWIWALIFAVCYELLSLPLRAALAGWSAPADVRRVLSRVAGPACLIMPLWFIGHFHQLGPWGPLGQGWFVWLAGMAALVALWPLIKIFKNPDAPTRLNALARALAYDAPARLDRPGRRVRLARQLALDAATMFLFFAFVAFRRWVPEMTFEVAASAAEKFANAMFFAACRDAQTLPPQDYWLAGHPLSYYYWGHWQWAFFSRLPQALGVGAEALLSLSLARAVTLIFEASFLAARALGLPGGWSVAAALGTAWGGNPASVVQLLHMLRAPYPFRWEGYDFWAPSRAIANVVDEFPAFSAILGDFHAHHLALPWAMAWVALTLGASRWVCSEKPQNTSRDPLFFLWTPKGLGAWIVWLVLGLCAVLSNLWNLPLIVHLFFMAAVALFFFPFGKASNFKSTLIYIKKDFPNYLKDTGLNFLLGLVLLPLCWWGLKRIMSGSVLPLVNPQTSQIQHLGGLPLCWLTETNRSAPLQLLGLWGFAVGLLLTLTCAEFIAHLRHRKSIKTWAFGLFFAGAAACAAPFIFPAVPWGIAWLWIGLGLWCLAGGCSGRWMSALAAWLGFGCCLVLAGLEVVYVDDAFVGELERYNTYFKFSYPLWPMLMVLGGAAAWRLWCLGRPGPLRWALRAGLLSVAAAMAVYPVCAIPARVLQARRGDTAPRQPTLDAYSFTTHRAGYQEEAPLLAWIRANVPPGQAIAEAGEPSPYDYGGRVASLAWHPVPLGWAHHEGQWRGTAGYKLCAQRRAALDRFYSASSPRAMRQAAADLGVKWAIWGKSEVNRYGPGALAMLRHTAPAAAQFPAAAPRYFLFDFRAAEAKMNQP